jgi:DNA-3-methyladenine glycosylase II
MGVKRSELSTNDFSFQECLRYLGRNDKECTHLVQEDRLLKPVQVGERLVLLEIETGKERLLLRSNQELGAAEWQEVHRYVQRFFDLDRDLKPFYEQVKADSLLSPLVAQFAGLRLVRMPDFFEAICWSILGQQINLNFAYQLKLAFAQRYGQLVQGTEQCGLYLFPRPETVANLDIETLREIKFSRQKSDYIIGVARSIVEGELDVEALYQLEPEVLHKQLVALRGIGNWTANYLMMKVFGIPSAFPIEDVGLHNAVKMGLDWERKPTLEELRTMAEGWRGWEAYATFYLWHSLLA